MVEKMRSLKGIGTYAEDGIREQNGLSSDDVHPDALFRTVNVIKPYTSLKDVGAVPVG